MKKTRYDIPDFKINLVDEKKISKIDKTINFLDNLCSVILVLLAIICLPFAIVLWCFLDIGNKNEKNDRKWSFFFVWGNIEHMFVFLFMQTYVRFLFVKPPNNYLLFAILQPPTCFFCIPSTTLHHRSIIALFFTFLICLFLMFSLDLKDFLLSLVHIYYLRYFDGKIAYF